jgi:hypothetical protein
MSEIKLLLLWNIFTILSLIGFYFAYLYGRKTTKFKWSEYFAMIIVPIIFVIYLIIFVDVKIFYLFVFSALTGFVAEGIIGFAYHKILNKKLWTYNRLSIKGYTSFLSIPLWGIGGVLFWLLSKIAGL